MKRKRHRGSRGRKKTAHRIRPLDQQAMRWIHSRAHRGYSKQSGKTLRSHRTVARYTGDLTRAVNWIADKQPIMRLKDITTKDAQAYINTRAQAGLSRKTLQGYALALMTLPHVEKLQLPPITASATKRSRAYTPHQISAVSAELSPAAQLAVRILVESGARVQDLASLQRADETTLQHVRHKQLDAERFTGRENWVRVKYIGKGGHEYLSTIHPATAQALEQYRLSAPRPFKERQISRALCQQYYALPAGQSLSQQWSQAAYRVLGYSHGIHGLRYTYAQTRLADLQQQGIPLATAKRWVSQTLGHYRSSILNVYLR